MWTIYKCTILGTSGGASAGWEVASEWTFGDCCSTFCFPASVAAPAAKITPLLKPKLLCTAALPTSALLSPPAQSPVQLGCKKLACAENENLEVGAKGTNQLHALSCKGVFNFLYNSNLSSLLLAFILWLLRRYARRLKIPCKCQNATIWPRWQKMAEGRRLLYCTQFR